MYSLKNLNIFFYRRLTMIDNYASLGQYGAMRITRMVLISILQRRREWTFRFY